MDREPDHLASEGRVCHCCDSVADLWEYPLYPAGDGTKLLCAFCASTLAGNTLDSPGSYGRFADVLQTVAYAHNLQAQALTKLQAQIEELAKAISASNAQQLDRDEAYAKLSAEVRRNSARGRRYR